MKSFGREGLAVYKKEKKNAYKILVGKHERKRKNRNTLGGVCYIYQSRPLTVDVYGEV
jgi:hypothetical protein